ncbi:uncharacterized protein DNG_09277 [Cephalotrichum gorgonifer]|uniref:NACHT domain-containing protein n=1 Tax=Cephalotrichum gorgonifer TaxID=2041049 RepID=A0AAE8SZZ6_9PEZI|nr:uncharacterized protein DNG_09277 [Cephalotrichum gorgonifer]
MSFSWAGGRRPLSSENPSRQADEPGQYGLFTISEPHDVDGSADLDVVAIHGLNGHFQRTWTDPATDFNWLRGALPTAIPGARVLSFSYNSILQFSKSTSNLNVFADQLLESLLVERHPPASRDRPLVFICHSLGGLVFKQALLRAYERERYRPIATRTVGVLFFGTPHRGSQFASVATVLGSIIKAVSLGANTNTQLSKDLEPDSRVLEQVSDGFVDKAKNLRIFTYYETQKLSFLKSLVVDQQSARLGLAGELAVPIDGDHRSICRYPDAADKRLKIVLGHILELREASTTISQPVRSARAAPEMNPIEEMDFLRSLNTSNPELHKARNPAPVEGTCAWILQHPTYRTWYTSEISSLLWLSADPGCGKSVLASFLVDHFASMPGEERPRVCYFFFKSDHLEQRDGIHALQAVLHQLLQQRPGIVALASSHLGKAGPKSTAALWNTFAHCAELPDGGEGGAISARDTICVLDGLDECEQDTKQALTFLLSKYYSENRPRASPGPRLKLLATSRPDIPFKLAFDNRKRDSKPGGAGNRVPASMIRLRGEDEIDAISNDISMVIRSDIFGLECQDFPPDILSAIEIQLVAKADRTFLWVTLVLRLLKERVEEGASRRDIDEILQSRDIDFVYAGLLRTRLKNPRVRRLLGMILATPRPMTVEELSVALAVRNPAGKLSGSKDFNDVEYDVVFPHENHLKGLCGHFIRIIRGKVYLVHETAREFLLRIKEAPADGAPDTERIFRLSGCRRELVETCLTYLHCLASGAPTARTLPFLHFAAKEWPPIYNDLTGREKNSPKRFTGLCHPSHPGFSTWMPLALHNIKQTGLSGDDLQYHCLCMLGLILPDSRDIGRRIQQEAQSATQLGPMSSNPGAMGNHYFPVELDSHGAVRLDFKAVGWRARLQGSQVAAPAAVTIRGFAAATVRTASLTEGSDDEDDKGYILL